MLPVLYTRGISQIDLLRHRLGCSGGISSVSAAVQLGCGAGRVGVGGVAGGRAAAAEATTHINNSLTSLALVMWRRRKRRVDKAKRVQDQDASGIGCSSGQGACGAKSPARRKSDKNKIGVVSTPVRSRKQSSRGAMPRQTSNVTAAVAKKVQRRYGAKYLIGQDLTTTSASAEDVTSGDDRRSNLSRSRSTDRSNNNMRRVRSIDRARTRSRDGRDSNGSGAGSKQHLKRHESKERHKPSRKLSIDPKLRNQIIEEAVKKARERQLSKSRESSKSKLSHGAKVERSDTIQAVRRKASSVHNKSRDDDSGKHGKYKGRKSPVGGGGGGRHNTSQDSKMTSRDRTPDDIEEWLKWRSYLNHQLSTYIIQGRSKNSPAVDIMSVPDKLDRETKNAIWSQAQREKPKTSLDSNAFIVYGIPRVSIRPNGPTFKISHYAVPYKGEEKVPVTERAMSPVQKGKPSHLLRTRLSVRDCAQEHGLAEKRPLTGNSLVKNTPRPLSPTVSNVSRRGSQNNNQRPLSPAKSPPLGSMCPTAARPLSTSASKCTDGRPEYNRPSNVMHLPRRSFSPAPRENQTSVLHPVGPANLREMYKKPFLRSISDQSATNSSSSRPVSPHRQNTGLSRCDSEYRRSTSESFRYDYNNDRTTAFDVNRNHGRPLSPQTMLSSQQTIHAKRPISPVARLNIDTLIRNDDVNQSYLTTPNDQSKASYIHELEEHFRELANPPPPPPPLPPKSFVNKN